MKAFIRKAYRIIVGFSEKLDSDHIGAYSAQAAFYIIISAFPSAMLLLNLIKLTPVTEEFLTTALGKIVPETIFPLVKYIISEIYEKTSGTFISITVIVTLWSASTGIMSIVKGLDNIYDTNKRKNYIILRLASGLYTIIFIVGMVLSLTMLVFGNSLLKFFKKQIPLLYDLVEWIISVRLLYVPIILTILFVALYQLISNKDYNALSHIPGAVFSAFGWVVFSFFYSIYIDNFSGRSYTYGSLTTIVLLMLWIYFCMYILFIGAEINVYFAKYIKKMRKRLEIHRQEKKEVRNENKQIK